jgi:hypothetical protein
MKLRSYIMILWVMGALFVPFNSDASNTRNEIFYAKEHLTAYLVEANLKEVLSSVAKQAKVNFSLNETIATKKISVLFDKLPIEEGIKRIIRPFSYSMIFSPLGRLEKVIIFENDPTSTSKTVSVTDHFKQSKTISEGDLNPALSLPGSPPESSYEGSPEEDEGLLPGLPDPEISPGKEMEGVDQDQQLTPEEKGDIVQDLHQPPGEMPIPPEMGDQTLSAPSP